MRRELPHEKGQELCSQTPSPERADDLPLHPSATEEDCKNCNWFSLCLIETPPQSAPSSLCIIILGHDLVLGTPCLYREHMSRLLPKPALELCFSTCCVLQHQSSSGSLSWVVSPSSTQQSRVRIWGQANVSVGLRLAERPVSILSAPACPPKCVLCNGSTMQSPHTHTYTYTHSPVCSQPAS